MTTALQKIAASRAFRVFIIAMIVLAGLVAGLETSRTLAERHGALLGALDMLILAAFITEAAVKIAAQGRQPWRYFADGWNVFDFTILVLCLLPDTGPFAAVLRLARVLRLLRLLSALPKLQLLIGALIRSLSAMGYVGLLLTLIFYIYAVAGVHLFGVHDPAHFGSLGMSLFTLFRVVTLDNWGDVFLVQLAGVHAVKVSVYFVSFVVLGTMIILNLFIGIVMNSMAESHAEMAAREQSAAAHGDPGAHLEAQLLAMEQALGEMKGRVASLRRIHHRPQQPASAAGPRVHQPAGAAA